MFKIVQNRVYSNLKPICPATLNLWPNLLRILSKKKSQTYAIIFYISFKQFPPIKIRMSVLKFFVKRFVCAAKKKGPYFEERLTYLFDDFLVSKIGDRNSA